MASMTSSVRRRRALPAGTPAYGSGQIGRPKETRTFATRGKLAPIGCTRSVPMRPTGTTGTPAVSARKATPVRPRYRRPSRERVPSG